MEEFVQTDEERQEEREASQAPSPPAWMDDQAQISRRVTKAMRKKHPHKLMRKNYESALKVACNRAGIPLNQGRRLASFLWEEIGNRILDGEIVHVPRFALMAIVPFGQVFRVHFCADAALRLLIREGTFTPTKKLAAFARRCQSIAASLPMYTKRGTTYQSLMEYDRRRMDRIKQRQMAWQEQLELDGER